MTSALLVATVSCRLHQRASLCFAVCSPSLLPSIFLSSSLSSFSSVYAVVVVVVVVVVVGVVVVVVVATSASLLLSHASLFYSNPPTVRARVSLETAAHTRVRLCAFGRAGFFKNR